MMIVYYFGLILILMVAWIIYTAQATQSKLDAIMKDLKCIEKTPEIYRVESEKFGILSAWHTSPVDAWREAIEQARKI